MVVRAAGALRHAHELERPLSSALLGLHAATVRSPQRHGSAAIVATSGYSRPPPISILFM